MSHVATLLLGLALLPSVLQGNRTGVVPQPPRVTLVLQFEAAVPNEIVSAMKNEFVRIYAATPYQFQWRSAESVKQGESFDDLAVVKMTGTCAADPLPLYDERGPLCLTHVTNGSVLPFVSLECDRLRKALERYLEGENTSAWQLIWVFRSM